MIVTVFIFVKFLVSNVNLGGAKIKAGAWDGG
jgi:hypothetical protein